jgi:copper resistance protein B
MEHAVFHYSSLALDAARRDGTTLSRWDGAGWIGTDFDRLWWNTEGHGIGGALESVEFRALYGRYVRRFWDVVVGYRQDVRPTGQGYLTAGVMGLAPYWFEVGVFGFLSDHGRPSVRVDAENDLFLTQRVILTIEGQIDWLITDDDELDLAAGIADLELGVRTRYEIRRKFAPYVDLTWVREAATRLPGPEGLDTDGLRIGLGLRLIY